VCIATEIASRTLSCTSLAHTEWGNHLPGCSSCLLDMQWEQRLRTDSTSLLGKGWLRLCRFGGSTYPRGTSDSRPCQWKGCTILLDKQCIVWHLDAACVCRPRKKGMMRCRHLDCASRACRNDMPLQMCCWSMDCTSRMGRKRMMHFRPMDCTCRMGSQGMPLEMCCRSTDCKSRLGRRCTKLDIHNSPETALQDTGNRDYLMPRVDNILHHIFHTSGQCRTTERPRPRAARRDLAASSTQPTLMQQPACSLRDRRLQPGPCVGPCATTRSACGGAAAV
jgi:hypothetical protein